MSTKRDGMLKGGDEHFAIRTSSQMLAYLPANIGGEFVVDIGRQLPEKIQAVVVAVGIAMSR
jgi:hypothetical protein